MIHRRGLGGLGGGGCTWTIGGGRFHHSKGIDAPDRSLYVQRMTCNESVIKEKVLEMIYNLCPNIKIIFSAISDVIFSCNYCHKLLKVFPKYGTDINADDNKPREMVLQESSTVSDGLDNHEDHRNLTEAHS